MTGRTVLVHGVLGGVGAVAAQLARWGGATIAAYATREDRPAFPFWPLLFDNVIIRLLGSDDFPADAKRQAAWDLTDAAQVGALSIPVGTPVALSEAAVAHDLVDAGARARVLLRITD